VIRIAITPTHSRRSPPTRHERNGDAVSVMGHYPQSSVREITNDDLPASTPTPRRKPAGT